MDLLTPEDIIFSPCLDCIFKACFVDSKNDHAELKALLSRILEREIDNLSIINGEPPVENASDRQIRYDVAVEFNDGELADVEIATYLDLGERGRIEYYLAKFLT
jgi:hypothetical protein